MKNRLILRIFSILLILSASTIKSAPWITPNDMKLKADIQLLADTGVINLPITTYPILWQSIVTSLNGIELESLNESQSVALAHIKRAMKRATNAGFSNELRAKVSNEPKQFTSFANTDFEKQKLSVSSEYMGDNFAGKIKINHRSDVSHLEEGSKIDFDGSYLAYKVGNWVFSAGAIEQWWGAGLDTNLIMTDNAGPLSAISIRRNDSAAFKSPWLNWIGPWTFTAQIAQLEEDRFVSNTKMWSSRAAFKPYQKLEVGLAWSYQWGGEGQPNSLKNFVRGLFGQTECPNGASSCDPSLESKLGNHLAGVDFRWADTIANVPYAFYAQTIGEDSSGPGIFSIADKAYLYGLETQFTWAEQRILANLEYTDTEVSCGGDFDSSQDCFYEHSVYQSGYRHHQRSMGSTYDNDAETLVLTIFGQQTNGNNWQVKLRDLDLNTNDRDQYPNDLNLGNTVSKVAQQVQQLEIEYQFEVFNGRMTLGGVLADSNLVDSFLGQNNIYVSFDYRITH